MIHRLYVHNYRCLENFELRLDGRPSTLLIGRNGSGKSTVLAVLEVLQKVAAGENRISRLVSPADFARDRSSVPIRFVIEVELHGRHFQYDLALELPDDTRELAVFEERLSCDGVDLYSRERQVARAAGYTSDPSATFPLDWRYVGLPMLDGREPAGPLRVFRNWLAAVHVVDPIPAMMSGEAHSSAALPDRHVSNFGAWFAGLVSQRPAEYMQIDAYLRGVLPDFAEISSQVVEEQAQSLVVRFKQDQANFSLPFEQLSDGEKCFFVGALLLAANRTRGPLLCFWDEPDNYLALSEIGHFVMEHRRAFEVGGQLVMTSHNPEAIERFSPENTIWLSRRSHLEPALAKPVAEAKMHGSLVAALVRGDEPL